MLLNLCSNTKTMKLQISLHGLFSYSIQWWYSKSKWVNYINVKILWRRSSDNISFSGIDVVVGPLALTVQCNALQWAIRLVWQCGQQHVTVGKKHSVTVTFTVENACSAPMDSAQKSVLQAVPAIVVFSFEYIWLSMNKYE